MMRCVFGINDCMERTTKMGQDNANEVLRAMRKGKRMAAASERMGKK